MSEERLLKRAAVYSVLLMLFVFFFSYYNQSNKENVSYANEKESMNSENTTKNLSNNDEKLDGIYENLSGEWIDTLGKEDENLRDIIGDKCIIIEKPVGLNRTTKLELQDLAVDSSIILTLSNPMQFSILHNQIKSYSDSVKSYNIAYGNVDVNGEYSIQITFLLDTTYAYKIYEDNDNFYIAGHGGIDSGTYSSGFEHLEKDMNLSMLLYLKEYLEQADFKVYYTRTTDRKLSLSQRVGLANAVNADLFLSIHCNASEDTTTNGIEVLYNEKQNELTSFRSIDFAEICLDEVNQLINKNNRGIVPRSQNVQIIGDAKVPVALVEVGFMSNTSDLNFLLQESNRKLVAKGIYNAILRALEEIGSSVRN